MKDCSDVQHLEVNSSDVGALINILMDAGYQCLCEKDGISNEITLVTAVHPKYSGRNFEITQE